MHARLTNLTRGNKKKEVFLAPPVRDGHLGYLKSSGWVIWSFKFNLIPQICLEKIVTDMDIYLKFWFEV